MKRNLSLYLILIILTFSFIYLIATEKQSLDVFEGKLKKIGSDWFMISDGDFFQLNIATEDFLSENNITLASKQLLKVRGTISDGIITVFQILSNNTILELRDPSGNPLWQPEKQSGNYFINPKKCIGCQLCVSICPTHAISMIHGRAVIDADKCIDCGICENGNNDYNGCPTNAIMRQD